MPKRLPQLCRPAPDRVALMLDMTIAFLKTLPRAAGIFLAFSAGVALAQTAPPAAPSTEPQAPAAPASQPATTQLPDSPGAAVQPHVDRIPAGPTVLLDTTAGRLTCKLFDKESPLAAANFIGLATGTKEWTDPTTNEKVHGKPFYNGTSFHRVIPGFMIQGGDRKGDGTGDAGYYFDNEITPGLDFDVAGRLAMANAGPNTNGTQFFITEVPYPDLNGKYTIFGQCDTHTVLMVASIARTERDSADKPLAPITLNRVIVVREGEAIPPAPVIPSAPSTTPAPALPVSPLPPPPQ